jgi:hypothetical protein
MYVFPVIKVVVVMVILFILLLYFIIGLVFVAVGSLCSHGLTG